MALVGHMAIKGQKQGQFKAEATAPKRKDRWIPFSSFEYEVDAPRDSASGLPTGKRQHKPITVVKEWGAATTQIFGALVANETLQDVIFEFIKTNPSGEEHVFHRITLTSATISRVRQFTGTPEEAAGGTPKHSAAVLALEAVSFVFQKILIENPDSKTSAQDDWEAEALHG